MSVESTFRNRSTDVIVRCTDETREHSSPPKITASHLRMPTSDRPLSVRYRIRHACSALPEKGTPSPDPIWLLTTERPASLRSTCLLAKLFVGQMRSPWHPYCLHTVTAARSALGRSMRGKDASRQPHQPNAPLNPAIPADPLSSDRPFIVVTRYNSSRARDLLRVASTRPSAWPSR